MADESDAAWLPPVHDMVASGTIDSTLKEE